jgi:hypothetical protein
MVFAFGAHAADKAEPPVLIIQSNALASQNEMTPQDVEVEIDWSQFIDDVSGQIEEPAAEQKPKKDLYVRFFEKAHAIVPDKLGKLFDALGIPESFKSFLIEDYLLPKFKNASRVITNAKGQGALIRIAGVAALGISDYMLQFLKTKSWGQRLPSRLQFGMVFGLGAAVLSFEHEGKRKILIRLFSDVEISKKVLNWMSELMIFGSVGRVADGMANFIKNPDKVMSLYQTRFTRSMMNVAGNMVTEPDYFEHNLDVAAGIFYPGGLYDLQVNEFRADFIFNLELMRKMRQRLENSCRMIFGF